MTDNESVLVTLKDGVLGVTLNRPEKLNSFNVDMHLALRAALQRAHDEADIRAVLLTGAGRAFSAGQVLSAIATGAPQGAARAQSGANAGGGTLGGDVFSEIIRATFLCYRIIFIFFF